MTEQKTEQTHTPGPWRVVEEPHPTMISTWSIRMGSQSLSFFPYSYQYADEEKTCGGYVANHEVHANARLIAAAPELLEALAGLIGCIDHGSENPAARLDAARAAIAKATGDQP